jgi:hypothetical protein
MKTLAALLLTALLLIPGIAVADPATDAALGLGAFAVFNQIISGTGIFGGVAARPVVVAPAPVVAPPPPVYVAPAPPVYYAPRPVVVAPAPVYVVPAPVYVRPAPRAYHRVHDWRWTHDRDRRHDHRWR